MNSDKWMFDCKLTDKNSHSIDYRKFKKIMDRATIDQIPAYIVEYRKHKDTLMVLREEDMLKILRYIEFLEEQSEGNELPGGGGS